MSLNKEIILATKSGLVELEQSVLKQKPSMRKYATFAFIKKVCEVCMKHHRQAFDGKSHIVFGQRLNPTGGKVYKSIKLRKLINNRRKIEQTYVEKIKTINQDKKIALKDLDKEILKLKSDLDKLNKFRIDNTKVVYKFQ